MEYPLDHSAALPHTPLVSELVPAFLDYLRVEENRAPGTLTRYESHLKRMLGEIGDMPISAIDAERLSLYKRRLMDAGLAPATIAALMSCLRSFFRYARHIRGLTVYDPEKIRRPKIPKHDVAYLTKAEVGRVLAAIPLHTFAGLRDRALAEVLCATGMRISEVLSLTRTQIDWEARQARIVGKGNKPRTVYFTDDALHRLTQYLQVRHDDEPALFVTTGDPPLPLHANGTWKRFRRYAENAGISKRVYPHILRHTMATTLLANGCPIGHIKVLLGHEHLSTTCRYYLGTMSDAEAKAAHGKYLSYAESPGEPDRKETHEKVSGQENTAPWSLDIDS